jgi:hypothetical protein
MGVLEPVIMHPGNTLQIWGPFPIYYHSKNRLEALC